LIKREASLFDPQWCSGVTDTNNGAFLSAGGVLEWFDEAQVKQFFSRLADHFPHAEIALNAQSRVGRAITNWNLRRTGMKDIATKWALKDARKMTKWDKRIKVIDQFPIFENFPRDPAWGVQIERWLNVTDRSGMSKIFHLQV
jgi:O-methyltransferase involved in polyketide biosynthesis